MTRPYELTRDGSRTTIRIRARGSAVLTSPGINRGTAFTEAERSALGLTGLLPAAVTTLDGQARRVYQQYLRQPTDLAKWVYLANLRDRNEVLFHRLLADHISEMLPIVYTPTVGQAIEQFSHEFRRSRGVYLSVDRPHEVAQALRSSGLGPDDVDLLVVTDSEGILGIGDQGVGGIEIAVGKLSVYTAAAGIHPRRVLAVVLDTGTDNLRLLGDEMYLGERHARIRDERYDVLVDTFVEAATSQFPHALVHWEDFGAANARRILDRWSERICTFNDDMQGTAAVVLAAVLSGLRRSGGRLADQRIVVHGAGTAGMGIADLLRDAMVADGLTPEEATRRFWGLTRDGLLVDDQPGLLDFQRPYARPRAEVREWSPGPLGLAEVVDRVAPTILIGTSTQAGAFSEPIVRRLAATVERPVILPLSNPTARAEATPADLYAWTDGRVLTATGSPFAPVTFAGRSHEIAQANNALVFPGLGLGVTVARAARISTGMIVAAARAVAEVPTDSLLPPMRDLRAVSAAVAVAVVRAAVADGVAGVEPVNVVQQVHDAMWRPEYPAIEVADEA